MLQNLIIQLHDLTLMCKTSSSYDLDKAHRMVKRNAERITDANPNQGPAWFVAHFISEMVCDSRFTDVYAQARFEPMSQTFGDVMSVNFEHGDLRVCVMLPVKND